MSQPILEAVAIAALLSFGCNSPSTAASSVPEERPSSPATAVTPTTASTQSPTTSPTLVAPTASPSAGGGNHQWVGSFRSDACDDRKYARRVTLGADGSVNGEDLISPCPPNVACVWSGIVSWTGTWTKGEGGLQFTPKADGTSNPAMKPLPSAFVWESQGSLTGIVGNKRCAYTRLSS